MVQTVFLVSTFTACTRPYLPSLSGRGRSVQRTPVERLPRPPGATGVRSMHASTSDTYRIFVSGLYDSGSQLLAPPACGQVVMVSPPPGTRRGLIFFAPVVGSIPITTSCTPRSNENAYLPLSASTKSKIACLPPVPTSGLPFGEVFSTMRPKDQS